MSGPSTYTPKSGFEKWIVDADTKEQLGKCPDIGATIAARPLTPKDVGIHGL